MPAPARLKIRKLVSLPCGARAASVQGCEFVRGGLPELRRRVEGCLVGAVCADAAAMGLHWVYDMDLMKQLTASAKSPAFYEPPSWYDNSVSPLASNHQIS